MIRRLEIEHLSAQLASIEALLASAPATDYVGRISLESRRDEIRAQLTELGQIEDRQARVVLSFGGQPVVGSAGIQASFVSSAVGSFQEIVTRMWGVEHGGAVAARGPIRNEEYSQLHVTQIMHGSFGFLLEELDPRGEPLFPSALKQAADTVADVIGSFADANEARFAATIEEINPRVFISVKKFFNTVYQDRAVFRLVEGDHDERFDEEAVARAWQRVENSKVDQEQIKVEGRLLGLIPIGRRFEFIPNVGEVIKGKVGTELSHNYIERIANEPFYLTKRWSGLVDKRLVERPDGAVSVSYTLLQLNEIEPEPNEDAG
jgi:hypothetical protein